jgi:flagellar hook-associated protein 3 FlgL
MRVTNSMMVRNMLDHLKNNMGDLNDLNEQLSSGKLFQMPSDAPIKVSDSMNYKSQLNRNSQFQRNTDQAENWLNMTESALKSGTEVIQRARELTIYASTDSVTPEDRQAIASEVKELRDELIDISRAELGDDYIFSGQKSDSEPFFITENADGTINNLKYDGDSTSVKRRLNENVEMTINLTGDEVFKEEIEALDKLFSDLNSGTADGETISNNSLAAMDKAINKFTELRSEVGGKLKRTGNLKNRLEANEVHLKQLKSQNEDADLAETITKLKMEENVYRASLASGARIMQQSLIDFIR